jgi:flagellar protein FlaF
MGMSVSIATAIIFIASLISFASIVGALDEAQNALMEAQRTSSEREVEELHTSIAITSIDRLNGTIEVMNSGDVTLSLNEIDILINGTMGNDLVSSMVVEGHEGSRLWMPGETLSVTMNGALEGAVIKIVTANGASIHD